MVEPGLYKRILELVPKNLKNPVEIVDDEPNIKIFAEYFWLQFFKKSQNKGESNLKFALWFKSNHVPILIATFLSFDNKNVALVR